MLIHALIIAVALFCTVGFIGTIWSWLTLATRPLHHWIDRAERNRLVFTAKALRRFAAATWNLNRFARRVNRMGWHGEVFVMPGREYATGDEITVFQNVHAVEPIFATSGNLPQWLMTVAEPAVGNSRLVFAIAALHNDGILILDELSECPPKDAGEAVYMLANGQGKSRATKT